MDSYGNNLLFRSAVSNTALWELKKRILTGKDSPEKHLIIYDNGKQFKVTIK